jgi:Putative Actinobacterial Holin-X, holin superfamily III
MAPLLRLATDLLQLTARHTGRQVAAVSGLVLAAAASAGVGLVCLFVALGIWLSQHMDPALAALLIAAMALLAAAVLLLAARARAARRPPAVSDLLSDPEVQRLLAAVKEGGGQAAVWAPLVAAFVAAYLAGARGGRH